MFAALPLLSECVQVYTQLVEEGEIVETPEGETPQAGKIFLKVRTCPFVSIFGIIRFDCSTSSK